MGNIMEHATRRRLGALAIILVAGSFVGSQLASFSRDASLSGWREGTLGYAEAVREQTRTGRPLAVYFYADWCSPCKRFRERVLSTPQVAAFMAGFIPVKINPDGGLADRALAERFGVAGYPAFFIVPAGSRRPVQIRGVAGVPSKQFMDACRKAVYSPSAGAQRM